jgi:hypothetical protein
MGFCSVCLVIGNLDWAMHKMSKYYMEGTYAVFYSTSYPNLVMYTIYCKNVSEE